MEPDTTEGRDESSRHLLGSPTTTERSFHPGTQDGEQATSAASLTNRKLIYVSHFLSTWNSRAFEFGAFLFLATVYPQTLLPASIYALARAASAATLSPWIGRLVDTCNRLTVTRASIVGQRIAVAASCVLLFGLVQLDAIREDQAMSPVALLLLSLLACLEKLSAVMNTISVERDWVVTIAGEDEESLRTMNSQMRRIDLFCKLIAPLFVSFIDSASTRTAILVTGIMTVCSVLPEYLTIARVYEAVPELARSRETVDTRNNHADSNRGLFDQLKGTLGITLTYIRHPVFLPSFALALLYLTVLSFNGQMITWLLAVGIPSSLIGVLRGISALFELSATWIAPLIMSKIGPVRSGIWFINYQIICVAIACTFFWLPTSTLSTKLCGIGAVTAVIISRIGLWGFDLSAQIIVQEEVEADIRGTFSSQEFAFQNVFEMLSFASTIVFSRPEQFNIPATISAVAVALAGVLYAAFVRMRRGHLVHLSKCMERQEKMNRSARDLGWRELQQSDGNYDETAYPAAAGNRAGDFIEYEDSID